MRGSGENAKGIQQAADLFGNDSVASTSRHSTPKLANSLRQIISSAQASTLRPAMKIPARFLLATMLTLLVGGCYQVPVTGRHAMNLVDDKEVTKMSINMFDDMKHRNKISRDKDRVEQLQRVGERISRV